MTVRIDSIVNELEADIIFGRLMPHQELLEDTLMSRFGAKRHEVRTVIRELVARRIVIKPKSKTARVKDFTPEEVDEIYFMRALLQREAIRIMPLPVSRASIDTLKSIHIKYVAAVSIDADQILIHQLNDEFHTNIFKLCGNKLLCSAITYYTEASNPIRSYGIVDRSWLDQAVYEHAEMIKAIENLDKNYLEKLVVEHMQPTRKLWEQNRSRFFRAS